MAGRSWKRSLQPGIRSDTQNKKRRAKARENRLLLQACSRALLTAHQSSTAGTAPQITWSPPRAKNSKFNYNRQVFFEILGEIGGVEKIATGKAIRELNRLQKRYGKARWRKMKGVAPGWSCRQCGATLV